MATQEEERPSFEHLMQELEGVVARLESDDLPLESAIDAYQRGVALAKEGHERLAEAERKVEEVTRAGRTRSIDPDTIVESHD